MPQVIDVYFEFSSSYSYICHEQITELANRQGLELDGDKYLAALRDDNYKSRLKQETTAAQDRDVFGCPTFTFKDEMFWGADRLSALETYIKTKKDT